MKQRKPQSLNQSKPKLRLRQLKQHLQKRSLEEHGFAMNMIIKRATLISRTSGAPVVARLWPDIITPADGRVGAAATQNILEAIAKRVE
jgi:hypothetical protein